MSLQNLALLKAIGAKMDYLNQRQALISQNIANADTPNYRPQDLKQADFGSMLKGFLGGGSGVSPVTLASTNAAHIANGFLDGGRTQAINAKKTYEVSPGGNAVVLEEQLLNAGQNLGDYNLMTNLYQKNMQLIRTALGNV